MTATDAFAICISSALRRADVELLQAQLSNGSEVWRHTHRADMALEIVRALRELRANHTRDLGVYAKVGEKMNGDHSRSPSRVGENRRKS